MGDLDVNDARLIIDSEMSESITLYWLSSECFKCDPSAIFTLAPSIVTTNTADLSTFYPAKMFLQYDDEVDTYVNCTLPQLENQGIYHVRVAENGTCTSEVVQPGNNVYHPLVAAILIQLFVSFVFRLGKVLYKKRYTTVSLTEDGSETSIHPNTGSNENDETANKRTENRRRVNSLDTFRGISLFIMIFVNYGGGKLWLFEHSPWNGLSIADLVFPWFVWIMGVSMAISMRSLRRKCVPREKVFLKIISRTLKLFCLGILLNSKGNTDITQVRIPGVLQRFAISYFCVATVHLFWAKATDVGELERWAKFRDVFLYWQEWLIMLSLVTAHTLITFLLKVPGCPTGYLGPGGNYKHAEHFNCTGGAAGYIDRKLFGVGHIYGAPTCNEIYGGNMAYDPEGLLGCLTSIFMTFLGLQAGKILLTYPKSAHRISRWLSWGFLCGLIAGILCGFSQNEGIIPVNKNLWSLSFILCLSCFGFFLLTFLYFIIDVRHYWSGAPFIYLGMNSILIYTGHIVLDGWFPLAWSGPNTLWRHMAMNLMAAYMWTLLAYVLHRNKVYWAL